MSGMINRDGKNKLGGESNGHFTESQIKATDRDAATGFPQKPEVSVDRNFLNLMLGNED